MCDPGQIAKPMSELQNYTAFENHVTRMRACSLCDGLPLGPRPLFKLDPSARVLIVGQAPGRITHERGRTFDDVSGDRLRDWLGVTSETFYNDPRIAILPMGFCYPGTGKGGDLPPREECAPAWRKTTLQYLDQLELTIVIGRYAIDWHIPEMKGKSLTRVVAEWRSLWPERLVLPHPSPRNNRWLAKNPHVEAKVIPVLRARVSEILHD